MPGFLIRRLAAAALLLYLVLTATFFVIHIAPGDPTQLFNDPRISHEQREQLRRYYGLDQPLPVQYVRWLSRALTGDWGRSTSSNRSAAIILLERLPNTGILVLGILVVEYGLGFFLGVLGAARPDSWLDHLIRILSLLFFAVPAFWLALLAIELFTVRWPLFPTNQMRSDGAELLTWGAQVMDVLNHLALPALTLGLARCGGVERFVRNGLLEVLSQDYIRTARALGLGPRRVMWMHALPNALGPLIQRFGITLPLLLSGSLIIEVIFAWPGIGQAIYNAILQRDYPVILTATAFSGMTVILGSLIADLLHSWIDPRVRDA